jgi:hypothetical protein
MSSPRKKVKQEKVIEPIEVRLGDMVLAYGSRPSPKNPHAVPGPLLKLFEMSKPDAKTGFRLAMIEHSLNPILKAYNDARRALLDEFAFPDEDEEGSYHFWKRKPDPEDPKDEGEVDEERKQAFNDAMDELLDETRPIDEAISVDDLSKSKIELSPNEILQILWLLEDGRELYEPKEEEEGPDAEPEPVTEEEYYEDSEEFYEEGD